MPHPTTARGTVYGLTIGGGISLSAVVACCVWLGSAKTTLEATAREVESLKPQVAQHAVQQAVIVEKMSRIETVLVRIERKIDERKP